MALASQASRKLFISLFTKKKTTLFLMGGKVCLSLGLSLDPPISNLKKNFLLWIEEKYIRNYSLETDGRAKVPVFYLSIILPSDFKFFYILLG
jgi:hypothetical protein